MTVYIALLRAVNLAGRSQIRMPALADLMHRTGFRDARTLLHSGNLVFRADGMEPAALEQTLERALADAFGLSTDLFVRTAAEWRSIVEQNPFPHEAETDPAHLVVAILKRAPDRHDWTQLRAAIRGRERLEGVGRQAYIVYPDGIGRSKLTAGLIEGKLRTRGTSRNWNTVGKLDQMASS
jgi:uncharacterized protein (DUF1697 family)